MLTSCWLDATVVRLIRVYILRLDGTDTSVSDGPILLFSPAHIQELDTSRHRKFQDFDYRGCHPETSTEAPIQHHLLRQGAHTLLQSSDHLR